MRYSAYSYYERWDGSFFERFPSCFLFRNFTLIAKRDFRPRGKYDTNRITEAGESGNTKTDGTKPPVFSVMVEGAGGELRGRVPVRHPQHRPAEESKVPPQIIDLFGNHVLRLE